MTDQEISVRDKQEVTSEERVRSGRSYQPDVDIYETRDALWLRADMPGVDEKEVEVRLADGVLSLEGPVAVGDYQNLEPVYTEYRVGNYVRRFALSNDIDAERIQARMVNGVLEVQLPKSERAKARRIEIRTAKS